MLTTTTRRVSLEARGTADDSDGPGSSSGEDGRAVPSDVRTPVVGVLLLKIGGKNDNSLLYGYRLPRLPHGEGSILLAAP